MSGVAVSDGRDAETALEPLMDVLRTAEAAGITLGVAPGLRAEADWVSVADLTRAPSAALEAMVEQAAERWSAPLHVAAALWWKGFSYWTALPVAVGWALGGHVPLMTPENTAVRPLPGEPFMIVGLNETRVASGTAGELGAVIRDTLIERLHAPVIETLHELTRTGRRGLWGSVAEALVEPFAMLGMGAGTAQGLLDAVGGPVAGLVEMPSLRRRTCCLWVTLPGSDACPTCCVSTPKEPACPTC
ncbi:(2Fe-2S)-binding protein [Actinomadura fulvescens]|uniref:(2Fe-2S)-binding protein n=1 Tax=Actinomadura fulvescens TaxID=46160 RepID=A0ABP6CAM8_9ACTN